MLLRWLSIVFTCLRCMQGHKVVEENEPPKHGEDYYKGPNRVYSKLRTRTLASIQLVKRGLQFALRPQGVGNHLAQVLGSLQWKHWDKARVWEYQCNHKHSHG